MLNPEGWTGIRTATWNQKLDLTSLSYGKLEECSDLECNVGCDQQTVKLLDNRDWWLNEDVMVHFSSYCGDKKKKKLLFWITLNYQIYFRPSFKPSWCQITRSSFPLGVTLWTFCGLSSSWIMQPCYDHTKTLESLHNDQKKTKPQLDRHHFFMHL